MRNFSLLNRVSVVQDACFSFFVVLCARVCVCAEVVGRHPPPISKFINERDVAFFLQFAGDFSSFIPFDDYFLSLKFAF